MMPAVELLVSLATALVILFGGGGVLGGTLLVGTLLAFVLYIQRFFDPIRTLTMEYAQLQRAMEMVEEEGLGVILYMQQEGRGIGLANKIKAYALQDKGRDTVEANRELGFEADLRDYGVGAQILASLGVKKMRLMTNNPKKIIGLEGYGLQVVDRIPVETEPRPENLRYLVTKCQKLGHLLNLKGRVSREVS
jgi:hypothetical protein